MPLTMREHFLLDPEVVFLNHGSFGACPKPVFAEMQRWQLAMERNPVEFLGRRSAVLLRAARQRLADFLGAGVDDLAFVPNATSGLNVVAHSWVHASVHASAPALTLRPGDEVLTTDHEYGACDATWRVICERSGASYRRVGIPLPFEAENFVARLMAAVTPRTRLIFFSHITSTTALIFPAAALCAAARERGITTLVDGAHAPGQIDLNLAEVGADFYTGNCHKWMCAPKGAAFLHVRPEHQAALQAPVVSWGYVAGEHGGGDTRLDAYVGQTLLERRLQWQGTRDIAAWLSVPAALDFLAAHGGPAQRADNHARALALQARVLARNGLKAIARDEDFGQMVPIPVRCSEPETLRAWLFAQHRIEVPVTQHAGQVFVRVSVMGYTHDAELQALENALAAAGV